MVSTQNTFLPPSGFPAILGTSPHAKVGSVQTVLASANLHTTAPPCESLTIQNLVGHVKSSSAAVLNGLSYDGQQPKSINHLIAMGSNRNDNAKTHDGMDETAAFHNDVAYFKVLLEAREKHRAAIRAKLQALQKLRTKQRKMYRKRTPTNPCTTALAAALVRAVNNPNSATDRSRSIRDEKWHTEPPCASPVSTDVESELSSEFDDGDVSHQKPVIRA